MTSTDTTYRTTAEQRLDAFLLAVGRAGIPAFDAFDDFANGITIWRQELLAYFHEPTSNGYGEGAINKVKVIKRRAYGLPTFTGFRKRVVIACGRRGHTTPPRSISENPNLNRRGGSVSPEPTKGPAVRRALAWPITSRQ